MADSLVTVGSYSTLYEASLAVGELEAFGFHPDLADGITIGLNWLWSNALGGVKVRVPEPEAGQARQLLGEESDGEAEEHEAPDTAAIGCPACGCRETSYRLDKRGAFLSWLILGVPILPTVAKRVCQACGHEWKP